MISTYPIATSSENTNYYVLSLNPTCTLSAPLCTPANHKFTVNISVTNDPFLQVTQQPLTVQVLESSNSLSSASSLAIPMHIAQSVGTPTISRTNKIANHQTSVSIDFTHQGVTSFSLVIDPLSTPTGNVSLLNTVTSVNLGGSQALTYTVGNGIINVVVNGQSNGVTNIILQGKNSFMVPAGTEHYKLTIRDSNFIYFSSVVTPIDTLVPYSSGVTLQRIVTTVGLSTNVYLNGAFPSSVPSMQVAFNNNNYTLSGSTFNISMGTILNPADVTDTTTFPILIKDTNLVAFQGSLAFSPVLTPQNLTAFTSLTLPSSLNVSEKTNLTIVLNDYSISTLGISTPIFFSSLLRCCIDPSCNQSKITSCALTTIPNSNNQIDLVLSTPQKVNTIHFEVTAINYQAQFTNSVVKIVSGLPSAEFDTPISVAITPMPITSTLTLGSHTVNAVNNYLLTIQPMAQNGFIGITLPSFVHTQLNSNNGAAYQLSINGTHSNVALTTDPHSLMLPVTPTTKNITLTLSGITNPPDSQPFPLNLQQSSDQAFTQVYGQNSFSIAMTSFDPITVHSATRNATKVGIAVILTLNMTTPSYSDTMVINFPPSQAYTSATCSVSTPNGNQPCSVLNSTAIKTTNRPGTSEYTISGLSNELSFSSTHQFDKVKVTMGLPYTRASTTNSSSTFITPKLTLGAITMNSIASSSDILLSATKLDYNFTIENTVNINGFIISYAPYFYYLPNQITCKINSLNANCSALTP